MTVGIISQRFLVTGATGFVGRRVVARLVALPQTTVRVAVRAAPPPGLFPPGVETVVVGEIGPDTDWTAAVTGIDGVVHLAARVHMMRDPAPDPLAAYRRVNTQGTLALAMVAARAGVERLVFLSSVKAVYDDGDAHLSTTAGTAVIGTSPYGLSKWEAEQGLDGIAAATGMAVTVLRPPLVYGPDAAGNFLSLLRLVARGVPLPLASIDNRRSLVFVDNLADAIVHLLSRPQPLTGRFFIHDGAPLSTPAIVRRLATGMGRSARLLPFPPALLRLTTRLLGRPGIYERLAGSLTVDDTPLRQGLAQEGVNWTPPVDAATALAATAAGFTNRH